ncbi:MAG: sigma-70 family RNA polymerase sigma factor [Candidatus Dormibacteraeota bacterium]|nr:sigma-70 family RNA polymerase sigma factor [Candidatus Dormibacteraeota bacterium]
MDLSLPAHAVPRDPGITADELARRYAAPVHRFAAMVSRGDQDSADLAQEALVRAIRALDRFDPARGSIESWLWRIVVNCAHDAGRLSRRRRFLLVRLQQEPPTIPNAEAAALQEIADSELLSLVRALPQRYRTLIALRFGAGLPFSEIGRQLGTTDRAAVMATRRALAQLRLTLEERR